MKFRDFITESFKKEYGYRVRLAADCTAEHMTQLENCLSKYELISATAFKRSPIEENPMEFVRAKGVKFISEVCSTDVILKYPVHPRILEVWLAVNLGLDHDRVLCYGVKEPRKLSAEMAAERVKADLDRAPNQADAALNREDQAHYIDEQQGAEELSLFGEEYNTKFLKELERIKAEKGADYFRNYPSKDEIMGDNLRPMWDTIHNMPNMGLGTETGKAVDVISQSSRRN
jgi:hypothetical protein